MIGRDRSQGAVRAVVAAISGAVVLAAWGMVFWGALYDPIKIFGDLPPGVADAAQTLKGNGTPTGTYFYPWPRNTPAAQEAWLRAHRQGPFFELRYVREGADPQAPVKFITGLAQYLSVATAGLLLCLIWGGRDRGRWDPVWLMLLVGATTSGFTRLDDPIWFNLPWRHSLLLLAHDLVAWLLLGGTFAAVLRPPTRNPSH